MHQNQAFLPPPVEVAHKVMWPPLGPGQFCDIEGCVNFAYKVCDFDMTVLKKNYFRGCNKKMCMDHCEIIKGSDEYDQKYVAMFNCTQCSESVRAARKKAMKRAKKIIAIMATVLVGTTFAIVGASGGFG